MSEFDDPALVGLGLALASGLLIGLERGWQQRERPEGHRVAGVRTFALIGLLGGLGGLLAQRWGAGMLIALLVLVGVYLVVGYLVTAHMHAVMGLTTSVAALATFAIGALATSGAWHVSAVAAVVVLALLRFKQLLHAGVGKLSEAEISSGTQLLLISVVVLPVLPDRGFGPYEALNPYRLWWAVVLLAVLSFAGFVLMRSLGRKRGLVFTALLGGIVSSTATTATLARWAGQTPGWRPLAAAGAALACAAMFARMAALVAIAAPGIGWDPVVIFVAMAVAGGVLGTFLAARSPRTSAWQPIAAALRAPVRSLPGRGDAGRPLSCRSLRGCWRHADRRCLGSGGRRCDHALDWPPGDRGRRHRRFGHPGLVHRRIRQSGHQTCPVDVAGR